MKKKSWLKQWLSGEPHFIIGSKADPYVYRWWVLPRNSKINVYLHKFLRDDEDRALHDHPWWFISIILWGGYWEVTPDGIRRRRWLSVAFRRADHQHRVVLHPGMERLKPCWTLVITGPRTREWGFWCPQGFVHWTVFTKPNSIGEIGRGCD